MITLETTNSRHHGQDEVRDWTQAMKRMLLAGLAFVFLPFAGFAQEIDVQSLVKTIQKVGPHGKGHREASAAWQTLSKADSSQLTEILAGMKDAHPLAENWLRAAAETIAERQVKRDEKLPTAPLETFLRDVRQSPRARRLAYELIAKVDAGAENRLIPQLANDPSVELRRDAVAMLLKQAAAIDSATRKEQAIAAYQTAFASARDLDQIAETAKKLKELGSPPDLATHFGFIRSWKLIGPFDNSNKKGFDVAYPPEKEIDLAASYEGKGTKVKWIDHTTMDEHGVVDLNKAVGKHMGAIAYAFTEFISEADRDVDLRLGCINGSKTWLNGDLMTSSHVYHTGMQIDQYIGRGRLRKGRNQILLKIAQNEQTEDWAQNWMFQFRVCDSVGTAVLSSDRSLSKSAASGG